MAQICRVPFGEVSNDRLQQLSSLKNRQEGLVQAASNGKAAVLPTAGKRSYDMSSLDFDSENVDPALSTFGAKKTKSGLEKSLLFTPILSTPVKSTIFTPASPRQTQSERSLSSRITRTPAGRSPKRQPRSLLNKSFKRIDPPFATSTPSTLPFSLDAALSDIANPTARKACPVPQKWEFKIYEDTPEEEAATVMEHSTLTLDLSSDDEAAAIKHADRGKENTPPEDYTPPSTNAHLQTRAQVEALDKMADESAPRTPLEELSVPVLETEEAPQTQKPAEISLTAEAPIQQSAKIDVPKATFDFTLSSILTSPVKSKDVDPRTEPIAIFEDLTAQANPIC